MNNITSIKEAQYIIIGIEDGWLKGDQKYYDEAKQYIIDHIDEI